MFGSAVSPRSWTFPHVGKFRIRQTERTAEPGERLRSAGNHACRKNFPAESWASELGLGQVPELVQGCGVQNPSFGFLILVCCSRHAHASPSMSKTRLTRAENIAQRTPNPQPTLSQHSNLNQASTGWIWKLEHTCAHWPKSEVCLVGW